MALCLESCYSCWGCVGSFLSIHFHHYDHYFFLKNIRAARLSRSPGWDGKNRYNLWVLSCRMNGLIGNIFLGASLGNILLIAFFSSRLVGLGKGRMSCGYSFSSTSEKPAFWGFQLETFFESFGLSWAFLSWTYLTWSVPQSLQVKGLTLILVYLLSFNSPLGTWNACSIFPLGNLVRFLPIIQVHFLVRFFAFVGAFGVKWHTYCLHRRLVGADLSLLLRELPSHTW